MENYVCPMCNRTLTHRNHGLYICDSYNGEFIGDNGPARFVKCRTEYYLHNYLHNPLGPAVIEPDGTQLYYLYGFKVSKENLGAVQVAAEMVQNKEILE